MALDGMTLSLIRRELEKELLGGRVDKVFQPAREEIIITMRSLGDSKKLLLSCAVQNARAQLTQIPVENPKQPPVFCMLLRKWLGSAKLTAIRQPGFERALFFDFETTNDFGDSVTITLAAEIMGRYSNLILVGEGGRILDSVKRVGADLSSLRQILPGLSYELPPAQQKVDLLEDGVSAVIDAIKESNRDIELSKLLQEVLSGASPLLSREIAHLALKGGSAIKSELNAEKTASLITELSALRERLSSGTAQPFMLINGENIPKDFSFIEITQYGNAMRGERFESFSALLDAFYGEKDTVERMKQKMSDFSRLLSARLERAERKLLAQREELKECKNRDTLRKYGDILSANLYMLKKGMDKAVVTDFFDEAQPTVEIPMDIRLTPVQNVQRYYKEYRKADTAEKMLIGLIEQGEREVEYLDSVSDLLFRARSEDELNAIRMELSQGGYIKALDKKGQKSGKDSLKLPPLKYISSDGYTILCGRNNLQNEKLTLKESRGNDIWFHVQKLAGSHVVVLSNGEEPPAKTYTEAAMIAAYNSKARNGFNVAVDYTAIKNVKKQPGGKAGMVVYEPYYTAIVTPDEQAVQALAEK